MPMLLKAYLPSTFHKLIGVAVVLCIVAALTFLFWARSTISQTSALSLETFAECMKTKGITMYGSDTCSNCLNQKKMFGDAFEKVNYVNCDFQKDQCQSHNITVYPVWIYDQNTLVGLQSLPELSSFSGCQLPQL